MIRLFLIRHGNTFESNQTPLQIGARTDLPLTEQGRQQAQRMAHYLQKTPLAAIYAGNLKRQTEFAQILANPFQLVPFSEPALTEIDYGDWEGLSSIELATRWPQEYAAWNASGQWPQNIFRSTLQEHRQALDEWLKRLRTTHSRGDTIAAISSNGLMRLFHPEKVKTGHFCELHLYPDHLHIHSWNQFPKQD